MKISSRPKNMMMFILGNKTYEMSKAALLGILVSFFENFKQKQEFMIFCVTKDKVAIAKKESYKDITLLELAIEEYKKNGFNVYHTQMNPEDLVYNKELKVRKKKGER